MNRQKRLIRLQVMLSSDEMALLDDWRFLNRMPSRAEAVRTLLRLGLNSQKSSLGVAAQRLG
jgi:hypothetical protein